MADTATDDGAYAAHCEVCGGIIAMSLADHEDIDEMVATWHGWDNSFVMRHSVEAVRKIPFCDYAADPHRRTNDHPDHTR